ncbi:hypothetical protein [Anaeromicropila herbilytica]|uniref:Uncharacterized protein n=1 Tax=Anaeromicropila herbilytica TaxID=2785025 RepID=A0A7R7ENC4_9FIRM|nr:hypothetical protein [Anaeromicropila herbilytica]BCN32125.1 hypothetical protein bsdtb5_34200 [Anaeromicropila herbilytica]
MRRNTCEEKTNGLKIDLNITKMVRYVCTAGVLIVAIIFGTKTYEKMLDQ